MPSSIEVLHTRWKNLIERKIDLSTADWSIFLNDLEIFRDFKIGLPRLDALRSRKMEFSRSHKHVNNVFACSIQSLSSAQASHQNLFSHSWMSRWRAQSLSRKLGNTMEGHYDFRTLALRVTWSHKNDLIGTIRSTIGPGAGRYFLSLVTHGIPGRYMDVA